MNNINASMQSSESCETAHGAPQGMATARILVVDDVPDNRDVLSRRLVRRGFEVAEAAGGHEALDKLAKESFDLVLLDIMMPDLSGNEVLRTVRETQTDDELPVIMVSAKSQSEDVVESLDLGANDYVTKPVDFTVALARINTQLTRKRAAETERLSKQRVESEATRLRHAVVEQSQTLIAANESLADETNKRRYSEEKLHYLAYHDALTGLLNRTAFRDTLNEALDDIAVSDQEPTLLFVDLDHFKTVNDLYGHDVGDELLRAVANRLTEILGSDVPIARLGGDEFAALIADGAQPRTAVEQAERIIAALDEPFAIGGRQFRVGASCGIAQASECASDLEQLIKAADLAMYRAKASGRSGYVLFEPRMFEEHRERRALEVDLREAVQRSEFEIYYQPLVNAATGEVTSFEALIRWPHAQRGMIAPEAFISIAEETGLICQIGAWVLREACKEAAGWDSNVHIAVNLSPLQFCDRNLLPTIVGALAASGLDPHRLEIEITETALLEAHDRNVEILAAIRNLGVKVSLDDFGTGYSSMSYLQSFNFDKIKIDRRFVHGLTGGPNSSAIIKAVAELGANIGVATTAEGIETEEQLDSIIRHGCTEAQGYLFSRPLTAADARAYMTRGGDRSK